MSEIAEIVRLVLEGQTWQAALALAGAGAGAGADDEATSALAAALVTEIDDKREMLDFLRELAFPPSPPPRLTERERLLALDAMGLLVCRLAMEAGSENWREILPAAAALSRTGSPYRVQEAAVGVLRRVASESFEASKGFWRESLTGDDGALAAACVRALSLSSAPVAKVLDLFDAVISPASRALREALASQALPQLGLRDAGAVYVRLARWSAAGDEAPRWIVARSLATSLGARYMQDALEILARLASDERPMVWRAVGVASSELAQRNPRLVLPELARWREDPKCWRAAELALAELAKRRDG